MVVGKFNWRKKKELKEKILELADKEEWAEISKLIPELIKYQANAYCTCEISEAVVDLSLRDLPEEIRENRKLLIKKCAEKLW